MTDRIKFEKWLHSLENNKNPDENWNDSTKSFTVKKSFSKSISPTKKGIWYNSKLEKHLLHKSNKLVFPASKMNKIIELENEFSVKFTTMNHNEADAKNLKTKILGKCKSVDKKQKEKLQSKSSKHLNYKIDIKRIQKEILISQTDSLGVNRDLLMKRTKKQLNKNSNVDNVSQSGSYARAMKEKIERNSRCGAATPENNKDKSRSSISSPLVNQDSVGNSTSRKKLQYKGKTLPPMSSEASKRAHTISPRKNIYKSQIKFSYLWDLRDIYNRRKAILQAKNIIAEKASLSILSKSRSKSKPKESQQPQAQHRTKKKPKHLKKCYRDGKYLTNYYINKKNKIIDEILGKMNSIPASINERVYRKNMEWLNNVNENKMKLEKEIQDDYKITTHEERNFKSFKRHSQVKFTDDNEYDNYFDEMYDEFKAPQFTISREKELANNILSTRVSKYKNSHTPITPVVRQLTPVDDPELAEHIENFDEDPSVKDSVTLGEEHAADRPLEERLEPNNPTAITNKISPLQLSELSELDQGETNREQKQQDRKSNGSKNYSQRIKEVESLIKEKKEKYERENEEYKLKSKKLIERYIDVNQKK